MPYPGTRVNQETIPLNANGVSGSASYYEVKFSDPSKPTGQIWTVWSVHRSKHAQCRTAATLVRGVARNLEQPGGQGRGKGPGRVDPPLDAASGPAAGRR